MLSIRKWRAPGGGATHIDNFILVEAEPPVCFKVLSKNI